MLVARHASGYQFCETPPEREKEPGEMKKPAPRSIRGADTAFGEPKLSR